MKPGLARSLLQGFDDKDMGLVVGPVGSFAELCYGNGRAAMLGEVLACARPAYVDGFPTSADAPWLRFLCTKILDGQYHRISLLPALTVQIRPHSRDFILLVLDLISDEAVIEQIRSTNPAGAALIAECQMALRIKTSLATGPTGEVAAGAAAPRPPRRSL
jgi:hypothetical protein